MMWQRYIEILVDDVMITNNDLDIYFRVKYDEACSAEIIVYNLAEETRKKIVKDKQIILKAGYKDDYGIIFAGTIKEVEDEIEGADVATNIYAIDDTSKLNKKEKLKYPADLTIEKVVESLFFHAGIPVGRIESVELKLKDLGYTTAWISGERTIKEMLESLAKDINTLTGKNFKFYVKNGAGYFVEENSHYEEAYVLTAETGLIDVKKLDSDSADYKIRALMLWKIAQDSILDIDSIKVKGLFKVISYEKVAKADDYYCEMEVKAL